MATDYSKRLAMPCYHRIASILGARRAEAAMLADISTSTGIPSNGAYPDAGQVDACARAGSSVRGVRMRQIRNQDVATVVDLLQQGFPARHRGYFLTALRRLQAYEPPEGTPRFGYLIEADTRIVGVLLAIFSFTEDQRQKSVRCNVTCWHVLPEYRVYAPLLILQLGRNPAITYTNISPALGTVNTIEAQGFRRFSSGAFAGVPVLARRRADVKVEEFSSAAKQAAGLTPRELDMLKDHQQFGCMSLVCTAADGPHPFVFQRRRVSLFPVPSAQLIYCRDVGDLTRFARPIGGFLAKRGMMWMLVAASRPMEGIPGKYFESKWPMYFKGPAPPNVGDLAYTEAALFGF